jgi:hypothetical protein
LESNQSKSKNQIPVFFRRPGLMHLGICALLVACGGEDTVEPSAPPPGPPTFTVVGHGAVTEQVGTTDLWVHGTVAYTGTGDIGSGVAGNTLWVWDISSPNTPIRVASVVVDADRVNDVKIRADGTLGVITHENSQDGLNGITLLDLSDPLRPQVITRFTSQLTAGVHNTWIEGDYVYAAGSLALGEGITIIDISNPADPQVVADFYAGSSAAHDVYVRDGLAFVSHLDAGLVILDVGNGIAGGTPTYPAEVSRIKTVGGNTHNAWYWPDAGYVFVGEESGRPGVVHVVDVSDLSNPVEVATFGVSGDTPHNFWLDEVRGILYVAWYSRGLRAIDVNGELLGLLEGREVGVIDYCRQSGECSGATRSWAPQLHDGLVYVSDKEHWAVDP